MSGVIFHEGRPCAPINSPELEAEIVRRVMQFAAARGSTPPDEGSLRTGIRNGWLSGWHAGYAAASAIEARSDATPQSGAAEDESATPKGDAQ
jgi:hypothetical protein